MSRLVYFAQARSWPNSKETLNYAIIYKLIIYSSRTEHSCHEVKLFCKSTIRIEVYMSRLPYKSNSCSDKSFVFELFIDRPSGKRSEVTNDKKTVFAFAIFHAQAHSWSTSNQNLKNYLISTLILVREGRSEIAI